MIFDSQIFFLAIYPANRCRVFGLFRYPPSHEWLENCFPFDVNRSVLPDERCSLFSIREWYKQYRNIEFISVEIMYGENLFKTLARMMSRV